MTPRVAEPVAAPPAVEIAPANADFDQYGRYREIEAGRPVDSTGSIPPFFGQEPYRGVGAWSGITDLADWVAKAPEPRLCFAKGFANYLMSSRVFDRTDSCALHRMSARFVNTGRLADLVEDIVTSDVFRRRFRQPQPVATRN